MSLGQHSAIAYGANVAVVVVEEEEALVWKKVDPVQVARLYGGVDTSFCGKTQT